MEIASFISDFENLPTKIQEQVLDYIEFLISKYKKKKKGIHHLNSIGKEGCLKWKKITQQ